MDTCVWRREVRAPSTLFRLHLTQRLSLTCSKANAGASKFCSAATSQCPTAGPLLSSPSPALWSLQMSLYLGAQSTGDMKGTGKRMTDLAEILRCPTNPNLSWIPIPPQNPNSHLHNEMRWCFSCSWVAKSCSMFSRPSSGVVPRHMRGSTVPGKAGLR